MYQVTLEIKEASEKELLFAYADPRILNEFLPTIADMLEKGQQFPVKLKLFFCPETNTINVNLLLYFM